ncbi:protein kinase [Sorangium cellulosum]|uniref:Protein kinase n=1 Tax=Sorangium cellulosum TaxID=56 RepID=A0A2L0F7S5_SORCE|nr:AAA family ATPase [Sorangium cellulosum]AUX47541.1 protein kinase [Sorangium cellulosum]
MVELIHNELIDTLHDGARSSVYLGRSKSSGELRVIKVARRGVNGIRNVAVLRRQYELTKKLDLDGIVKVYDIEVRLDYAALIMEHFAGRSLRAILDDGRDVGLVPAVRIGVGLADTLGAIHERNVVHSDIKPGHIIVDAGMSTSKITDFSVASLLPGERAAACDPWSAGEGTLQYMSPEQTGRMNRSIDFRSDYYSLGVTLYELVTRRLPFETTDPVQLVHCHIAKTPLPPHQVRPEVPEALSRVIMKLLAKTAEERYQSPSGLKSDLLTCLDLLEGRAPASGFVPGRQDRPSRLQISQKLYGRQEEVDALRRAFRDISGSGPEGAPGGSSELVLVAGYSGIGKSAVVNEIHKAIAKDGGYFAAGKFDQFTRNIPYSSVIAALRELVRRLLTRSGDELADWRARILSAVAPNGQVIAEVIPEIELVIGKQPPVPALGPVETRHRFNRTFRSFIGAIALKARALVLFLDDLQWADSGSLDLIGLVLEDPDIHHLLLIGAYRDNEVDDAHPLVALLSALRKSQARVRTLTLRPLAREHVNQLVTDTLGAHEDECRPLSDVLFARTGGNPFFATQFLASLYRERHLWFSSEQGAWRWSTAGVARMGAAENVVDLMIRRIRSLAGATQRALQLAACIGNQFDLKLLALVSEKDLRATDEDLEEALEAGLIVPVDSDYKIARFLDEADGEPVSFKFLHDRVQQAAYELLAESEQKRNHVRIGRLMLQSTPAASIEERVYEIVMHLNLGAELIIDAQQRYEAVALNLRAGQKARRSTAYGPAAQCLRAAAAFLPEDAWQTDHELSLRVNTALVGIEYLMGNAERAEEYARVVVEHARDILEEVPIHESALQFYMVQGRILDAVDTGVRVLGMLDVPLSDAPPVDVDVARLAQLPPLTDERMQAAIRVLASLIPAVFLARPTLIPAVTFTMVNLCVRYGNSPLAAFAYANYGLIQCNFMNNVDEGFALGQLALDLVRRFGAVELESKIYATMYVFIYHWKRHLKETIEPMHHAVQVGLETGDIDFATYGTSSHSTYSLFVGEDLATVELRMTYSVDLSRKFNHQFTIGYVGVWKQLVLSLRDPSVEKLRLVGESFDETTMIPRLGPSRTSMFALHLAKGMLLYYFGNVRQACDCLRTGVQYRDSAAGMFTLVLHNFYSSLSMLAALDQLPEEERSAALAEVEANQRMLAAWARSAPENSQHKHDLVSAERARVEGEGAVVDAMELYDRAIEGARRQGYMHEEALAYELAASFYQSRGRREIARHYMTLAYRGYALWGAGAKCQSLLAAFPQLIFEATPEPPVSVKGTSSHDGMALDLLTVVKASQALASEIVLERLLEELMTIVIENVGARRGVLALARGEALFVEAEGTAEPEQVDVLSAVPVASCEKVPLSVVSYVQRTLQSVLSDNAAAEPRFSLDPYVRERQTKSVLCAPIVRQGRLVGVLYLENDLSTGVFTRDRVELLSLLSTQIAISIENARLYEGLEQAVVARTEELRLSNEQLQAVNGRLQVELAERERLQAERVQMQEEIIEAQRARLEELSTPFIPITDEIMVMPIVGTVDDRRAAQMMEVAMKGVVASAAKVVIVDITGVKVMDTGVAGSLMSLAKAVGLLGSRVMLTGLRPAVAQSLVALGLDLGSIETRSNLKAGIAHAMRRVAAARRA